jgi:osmotically-inducible protein OsmY
LFASAAAQDVRNRTTLFPGLWLLLGAATIVRGVYKAESTADQQKEHRPDLEITRDIRRSILQDKSLSTYAHNVKVISQNGMVTLKGPVRSGEEKSAIEGKAAVLPRTLDEIHIRWRPDPSASGCGAGGSGH